MLLSMRAAAKILKAREQYVNGQIRLIFQPAEEGFAGADAMISEGVLRDITAIFGIHGGLTVLILLFNTCCRGTMTLHH